MESMPKGFEELTDTGQKTVALAVMAVRMILAEDQERKHRERFEFARKVWNAFNHGFGVFKKEVDNLFKN